MPGETLPTWLCAIAPAATPPHADVSMGDDAAALAWRLRLGEGHIPVVARVARNQVLLDPRTVMPEQDTELLLAVRAAFLSA